MTRQGSEREVFCPYFQRAIELIGGRWTGAIIRAMMGGCHRFSDITSSVPGLSDRMLSERLRELEGEGIIRRIVVPEMPVRVEYRLTEKGEALSAVIDSIVDWLSAWTDDHPAPLVHAEPGL